MSDPWINDFISGWFLGGIVLLFIDLLREIVEDKRYQKEESNDE